MGIRFPAEACGWERRSAIGATLMSCRKGVVKDIVLHDDPVSISLSVLPWAELHSPTEHVQYLLHIDGERYSVFALDASPL